MKIKRIIILLSILAIVIVIGCFAFMYFTAAAVKEAFYGPISKDSVKRLGLLPEHIELGIDPRAGYTVHFQDYSLKISGYNDVVIDEVFNNEYHIGSDKTISFRNMDDLRSDSLFDYPYISSYIEKATGRKIDTAYDFLDASFKCTPNDFSLLDAEKNKGVSLLLETKRDNMGYGCYQFNNGVVKGYISMILPQIFAISVLFSNCDEPDSCYEILFVRFSTDEVKEMLGTITFDGTNQ